MHATMLLCDHARVSSQKLDMLGAGWNLISSPANFGVGIIFVIPCEEQRQSFSFRVALVDSEGHLVMSQFGTPVMELRGDLTPDNHSSQVVGPPLHLPLALNVRDALLRPGVYHVQLHLGDVMAPTAELHFEVLP